MVRRMSRLGRKLAAAICSLTLVAALAGCESRPRVVVYGDSIIYESRTEIRQWAAARGWDARLIARFGGAPCTLFDQMRQDRANPPETVVISFVGNTGVAPCVTGDPVESYRAQIREWKRIWTGTGTRLVLVLVPFTPVTTSEAVQQAMAQEAALLRIPVVDGGTDISPGRRYFWTQPCLRGERCVGNQINPAVAPGRNIVRANDRTHLCPGGGHGTDPCPYYSSGSWRYGRNLTSALAP